MRHDKGGAVPQKDDDEVFSSDGEGGSNKTRRTSLKKQITKEIKEGVKEIKVRIRDGWLKIRSVA